MDDGPKDLRQAHRASRYRNRPRRSQSKAPRVGYGLPLSPLVAIWPRFGLTIMHLTLETSTDVGSTSVGTTVYALTVEVPFVLSLAPHLFLAFGPTLDLG